MQLQRCCVVTRATQRILISHSDATRDALSVQQTSGDPQSAFYVTREAQSQKHSRPAPSNVRMDSPWLRTDRQTVTKTRTVTHTQTESHTDTDRQVRRATHARTHTRAHAHLFDPLVRVGLQHTESRIHVDAQQAANQVDRCNKRALGLADASRGPANHVRGNNTHNLHVSSHLQTSLSNKGNKAVTRL